MSQADFPEDLQLRFAVDADSAAVIDLVSRCYAEYEGCVLLVDEEEPELRCPATTAKFSRIWVVCDEAARLVGMIACTLHADHVELKKLYLDPLVRGRSLSRRLVALVEDFARNADRKTVQLWSDTRFLTAHAVYSHLGYRATGRERALHDASQTVEYHYEKTLN